jgi:hypothetical protein
MTESEQTTGDTTAPDTAAVQPAETSTGSEGLKAAPDTAWLETELIRSRSPWERQHGEPPVEER